MKLGTLLLRNAAIGLTQLEAALRNQVLYGGRLGTNLVELGFIDLELLSSYLAELTGFPIATPTLLDDADHTLLEKLGGDDAHRLRAVPLGFLGEGTDTVAVGMVDPTDAEAIDELRERLGTRVTPYVVPELRALYYLEKHFGLPRRARFLRTARAEGPVADNRRREQPTGMAMPPAFTLEPRKRRASQAPLTPPEPPPVALPYGAACERIDTAAHREQIADVFVEYAKGRLDALVVLLIRDGNALGWRGYLAPPATLKAPLDELSLPLGGASSLQSAHDSGQIFLGPAPSAARPVEQALWRTLSAVPEPTSVLVVPVLVKSRAVNLVYAHLLAGVPPTSVVSELAELASRAQASYVRLIRQARGS
jgi:MshEN domain